MAWIQSLQFYVYNPHDVHLSQIFPSWSRFFPFFLKGFIFPPLAGLYRNLNLFVNQASLAHLQSSVKYAFAALATTPAGHPSLPHYQQRLATSLCDRYKRLGDAKDLRLALMLQTSALRATPSTHKNINWHRQHLQFTYRLLYQHRGELADLESGISIEHLAESELSATSSPDLVRLAWWQHNLAISYQLRYSRLRFAEDLESQIKWAHAAVDSTAEGDPLLPSRQHSLGIAYADRFHQDKDMHDLDLALFWIHSFISNISSIDQLQLSRGRQSLATVYYARYIFQERLEDLQTAINLCHESIVVIPKGHPSLGPCCHNLAHYHFLRYRKLDVYEDLEESINWALKAAEESPKTSPNSGIYAGQLGMSYLERYQKLGNLGDLESAMKWNETAVLMTDKGHAKAAYHQNNYSIAFLLRYRRHRNRGDLDLALEWCKAAIAITQLDDPELPEREQQLTIIYQDLFAQSQDVKYLDMALQTHQVIVDATPSTHSYASERFSNLATIHSIYYQHKGGLDHREAVMKWSHDALDACRPDGPLRHVYIHNLALQYFNRYIRLKNLEDLEHSLKLADEALTLIPADHPKLAKYCQVLAEAYAERFNLLHETEERDRALQFFQRSAETANGDPIVLWKVAQKWASFSELHQLSDCIKAYGTAYRILPELFWLGSDITSRHETLVKYEVATVTSKAIAACIKHQHLELAVEFLEQSLALTFQQLLDLQTDLSALKEKFPGYTSMLEKVSTELQKIAITTPDQPEFRTTPGRTTQWDRQRKLVIERDALLKTIRQIPEFENFLLPVPFNSLKCAADFGPVIIINCSAKKCDALIMLTGGKLLHIILPRVTVNTVSKQCERLRTALRRYGIHSRDIDADRAGRQIFAKREDGAAVINAVLSWIWSLIVSPIFKVLEENGIVGGRIWWCLTGPLTYLPLHAAGPPTAYVPSYTSTLSALIRARSSPTAAKKVSIIAVGLSSVKEGDITHLPNVAREIEALKEVAGVQRTSVFMNEDATLDTISALLPQSTWLHLACHGQQGNAQDALRSGLLLYDGRKLELEKIINTPIPGAEFVFLSACETAMGDVDMTSESLHLAGGMIFAGFKAVIGTLWSINDNDGPNVARSVYSHLFKDGREPDVRDTAEALDLAVKALREQGIPPHRWVPFIHIGV